VEYELGLNETFGLRVLGSGEVYGSQQGVVLALLAGLLALGWVESGRPADVFLSAGWTQAVYGLRLAAGLAMLAAAVRWWQESAA
jgi:hypothetical protein